MNHDDSSEQTAEQKPDKIAKRTDFILIAIVVIVLLSAVVYGIITST